MLILFMANLQRSFGVCFDDHDEPLAVELLLFLADAADLVELRRRDRLPAAHIAERCVGEDDERRNAALYRTARPSASG